MRFQDSKVTHEDIYRGQASLLAGVGPRDPQRALAAGAEQASEPLKLQRG
jgi:hypothetical protein